MLLSKKDVKLSHQETSKAMINDPKYSDVILIVGKSKIRIFAHKVILAGFSEYFEASFNQQFKQVRSEDGKQQILTLPEFDQETIMTVLEYLYSGSTDKITDINVAAVYMVADFLHLGCLIEACQDKLNRKNVWELFKVGYNLEHFSFVQSCIIVMRPFILDVAYDVLSSLTIDMVYAVVIGYRSNGSDIKIWNFVEKYGKAFSSTNIIDELSVEKILDVLSSLKSGMFFFRFSPEQHSTILPPFQNPIINSQFRTKLNTYFKHYLVKDILLESVIPTSKIFMDQEHFSTIITQLSAMINESHGTDKMLEWEALFTAAEHEFKGEAFHYHCDEKGPTVTIIKANNRIAAAYNCDSWKRYIGDDIAEYDGEGFTENCSGFIAAIDVNGITKFQRNRAVQYGAQSHPRFGPIFSDHNVNPDSFDLGIGIYGVNNVSYSNLGHSFGVSDTLLFDESEFVIDEFEVFSVKEV